MQADLQKKKKVILIIKINAKCPSEPPTTLFQQKIGKLVSLEPKNHRTGTTWWLSGWLNSAYTKMSWLRRIKSNLAIFYQGKTDIKLNYSNLTKNQSNNHQSLLNTPAWNIVGEWNVLLLWRIPLVHDHHHHQRLVPHQFLHSNPGLHSFNCQMGRTATIRERERERVGMFDIYLRYMDMLIRL